jgi:hypothetical protein
MTENNAMKVGQCRCLDIRFEVVGLPLLVEFCHCRSCRHSVGAPLIAWAGYDSDRFRFVRCKPTNYISSSGVDQTFCGCCGTSLTLTDKRFSNEVYVSLSSFDDEDAPSPEIHIWHSERLPWVETADDLPRFQQFKSDGVTE